MGSLALLEAVGADAIRQGVAAKYDEVARHPSGRFRFPVGRTFAEQVGYPPALLAEFPASAAESFAGVAAPILAAGVQPGETVLDLGSGAGLDAIIAARLAGPSGRVIGVDMAPEMLAKARANAEAAGLAHVEFRPGCAEALPVADAEVDLVHINGLLNLSPEKPRVLGEIHRVLRPGGRFVMAEIVTDGSLPPAEVKTLEDWFR